MTSTGRLEVMGRRIWMLGEPAPGNWKTGKTGAGKSSEDYRSAGRRGPGCDVPAAGSGGPGAAGLKLGYQHECVDGGGCVYRSDGPDYPVFSQTSQHFVVIYPVGSRLCSLARSETERWPSSAPEPRSVPCELESVLRYIGFAEAGRSQIGPHREMAAGPSLQYRRRGRVPLSKDRPLQHSATNRNFHFSRG